MKTWRGRKNSIAVRTTVDHLAERQIVPALPSSKNRLGHALRSRMSAAASWREGRPIAVNRSNARLAGSFAYMRPHSSVC